MRRIAERIGVLEAMARTDLDALLDRVASGYRPGALEAHSMVDPDWRGALDQAEREAGSVLRELRAADAALARWREALTELTRLWARVTEPGDRPEAANGAEAPVLEEVA
jgi:hypothetical protein